MTTTPPPDRASRARARLHHLADLRREYDADRPAAILEAVDTGLEHREIAAILEVTEKTVGRVVRAANEAAQPIAGQPKADTESDG
ncbi:helix-turn-helix domain-containing protein [Frankia sp. AgW1.1]|uniref:helix-turn-helix domain-containing protein n=1 Tax=Frankia sp. AgW1.1 TaxID=1836971 RepID=UPI00193192D9|nr:helix-turn-helix domain-containing protein [Frankia sp. AgW1.1]MBL7487062.1 helix-turn-helix domain-containing protein [Frankia sp. AgW1.1]